MLGDIAEVLDGEEELVGPLEVKEPADGGLDVGLSDPLEQARDGEAGELGDAEEAQLVLKEQGEELVIAGGWFGRGRRIVGRVVHLPKGERMRARAHR